MKKVFIIGVGIDTTSYQAATEQIIDWAMQRQSRYVCIANVHMIMESYDDMGFRNIVNAADLVTPDGMPLVWMMKWQGFRKQERVYGPTLTLHVLETAEREGIPVGFFGSTQETLKKLKTNLQERYPFLHIVYDYAPPFRSLTTGENMELVKTINGSGACILFVGLGCPKQERWMSMNKGRIKAVMLGVGAAFDFLAGVKPQAPQWMQLAGLEWLFRLASEPHRLWRRYLYHNPRFILLGLLQLSGLGYFNSKQDPL